MADNGQLPTGLTDLFEIKMKTDPLRTFLIQVLNRLNALEKERDELETRVKSLEDGS